MSRSSRMLALLTLALVVCAPAVALAQTSVPSYAVQAWVGGDPGSPDRVLLIASARVPTSTSLPTTISIPLPDGVEVSWAGEIVSPDGTADIRRTGTITESVGGRAYTFTLEEGYEGQIEGLWKALEERDDSRVGVELTWVQTVPAEIVAFSVRTPAGAQAIRVEPQSNAAPQENAAGERLYTLPSKDLAPGAKHVLDISYLGSGSGTAGSTANRTNVLIAALGAAVLLLAAVIAFVVRRESAGRTPTD